MQSRTDGKKGGEHLVVLVHGLWGSAQNLARLEAVLHHCCGKGDGDDSGDGDGDDDGSAAIHTYLPACFSHFKTYDGIESIGDYVIQDLFVHLRKLKDEHGIVIDRISFIGYSLGGLISRYIVGQLYNVGFFNSIKPVIFTTMATPHLGSHFYSTASVLNVLGSNFLGQTGKDLFMVEGRDGILYKMSEVDSPYMKALSLFPTRICVANTKFDRTVGFYSAFITKYDPFVQWEQVEPVFISQLPTAAITENKKKIECMVIDFAQTRRLPKGSISSHQTPNFKNAFIAMSFVSIFVFPLIFTASTFATIKSKFRRRLLGKAQLQKLWDDLKSDLLGSEPSNLTVKDLDDNDDGYDEESQMKPNAPGLSHLTRKVVEDGLVGALEGDESDYDLVEDNISDGETSTLDKNANSDHYDIDLKFDINYTTRSTTVNQLVKNLDCSDLQNTLVTDGLTPLPFSPVREEMLNNLNSLKWTKMAVLLHSLNAHQSVVGRRGFERTTESVPLLFLYAFLFEESMKKLNQ